MAISDKQLLRDLLRNIVIVTTFYSIAFLLLFTWCAISGNTTILSRQNLLNWDAQHYFKVAKNGYSEAYLTAFFPLFPFVWKLLNTGALGIVLLMVPVYFAAVSMLAWTLNFSLKELILALSVPSLIFMFLPYSETLFYFGGVMLLCGLSKDKKNIVCLGLLVCSLSRPAIYVLLPAVIICEYLLSPNYKIFIKTGIIYILAIVSGLFLTFFIQHLYTGEWLTFFESQRKWDNRLRLPVLPLTTWGGGLIVRLDGTALLVSIIAVVITLKLILDNFKNKQLRISKAALFSILYLAGMGMLVLSLRGGSLFSLNRFIFASPFFTVALVYFIRHVFLTQKQLMYGLLLLTLYWLLFASYVHIQAFLLFFLVSVYILLYTLINHKNKAIGAAVTSITVTCNILLFICFYYRFLSNLWIA